VYKQLDIHIITPPQDREGS